MSIYSTGKPEILLNDYNVNRSCNKHLFEFVKQVIDSTEGFAPVLSGLKAPAADERISYGMPFYDYMGRLVYFAAFQKTHWTLYAHSSHRGTQK
jgi:hypothetical protein